MHNRKNQGFAIITALLLIVVLGAMAVTFFSLTKTELNTTTAVADSTKGFYAAEAGLNVRGAQIRSTFNGFQRPEGSPPTSENPCLDGDNGSGNFACDDSLIIQGRTVRTYAEERTCLDTGTGGNVANDGICDTDTATVGGARLPTVITIEQNDRFAGLNAQEYKYSTFSDAYNTRGELEARLEMVFRSRLVPLFQFAAFTDGDLELGNGPEMTLNGRVHSNENIYFAPHNKLTIGGRITSAGKVMLGRKQGDDQRNDSSCGGDVIVRTASGQDRDISAGGSSCVAQEITQDNLTATGGTVRQDTAELDIPDVGVIDRDPDPDNAEKAVYWNKADIRIVLDLGQDPPQPQVRSVSDTNMVALTQRLNNCPDAVGVSNSFHNRRENKNIDMLDVNVEAFLNCLDDQPGFPDLDDDTEGGLVVHLSVDGPDSDTINNYGTRLTNGAEFHEDVVGLTVVSDQALYVQGDYNSENKKPASLLADSLNVLSNSWCDEFKNDTCAAPEYKKDRKSNERDNRNVWERQAENTVINAAMMANMDETGSTDSQGNQKAGNGGLHNFPRMHEDWSPNGEKETLSIRGSFVSLGKPKHVEGAWSCCSRVYQPPVRDWDYDTDFNDATNLPPLSPRFVYLVQEVFMRDFEQN